MVFYRNIHEQLFLIFNTKSEKTLKLISFNSTFSVENLICQFFDLNHSPTFSMSHGFFVLYKKNYSNRYYKQRNIVSNKILVWEKASVSDLNQNYNFSQERVLLAGNPKYQYNVKTKNRLLKNILFY